MRITKKDLNVLNTISYDSDDYYIYDENECIDYDYLIAEIDHNYIVELINSIIDSYLIVSGSSGTWQGSREIVDGYVDDVENVLDRLNVDRISIYYDPEDLAIVISGSHHDGVNTYYLRKPEWLNKKELINLGRSINQYESNLKFHMHKSELIEELQELLENYN